MPEPKGTTVISADLNSGALGRPVLDARGERIGELVAIYADTDSDVAAFAGVKLGGFRRHRVVLVSLASATLGRGSVTVLCGKKLAASAPSNAALPVEESAALYAHYDIPFPDEGTALRRLAPR